MHAGLNKLSISLLAATPLVVFAFSGGPPPNRTGNPTDDNGANCSACHRGNSVNDGRGRLTITASNYTPGERQKIRVRLEHPDALRWGFELTARLESNPAAGAGSFLPNDEVRIICAPAGSNPPCEGQPEFVTHVRASTSPGTSGGRTWEVEWNPPNTNVGPVVFFAAGNAANNNNTNAGDFIYTTSLTIQPVTASGPRPAISRNGVADAFNFQTAIASSTWVAIFGQNLAPVTRTWDDAISGDSLPTTLSGVRVRINNRPAAIYFVSPGQINALAPLDDAVGDVSVVVSTPAGDSEPVTVRKAAAAPAFYAPFAQNNRLFVTAVALDGTIVGKVGLDPRAQRAARPGETILLFGTGFGATNPPAPTDRVVSGSPSLVNKPIIRINNVEAPFPGNGNLVAAGLYQFNITVPASLADGDHPIVAETSGGILSANTVFISVAR